MRHLLSMDPYPEPGESSPYPWSNFVKIIFNIINILPCSLFPSVFLSKTLYASVLCPHMLPSQPISFLLIRSTKSYLLRSTDHEASDLVVFTTPLSPHPSVSSICPSTLFLNTVGLCSFLSVTDQVFVKGACIPCDISILHLSVVYIMYVHIVWVMSLMLGNAVLRVGVRELAHEMEVCNVTGIPNEFEAVDEYRHLTGKDCYHEVWEYFM